MAERSRLHGWEIELHRHKRFLQILYIHAGGAEARLTFRPESRRHVARPCGQSQTMQVEDAPKVDIDNVVELLDDVFCNLASRVMPALFTQLSIR